MGITFQMVSHLMCMETLTINFPYPPLPHLLWSVKLNVFYILYIRIYSTYELEEGTVAQNSYMEF